MSEDSPVAAKWYNLPETAKIGTHEYSIVWDKTLKGHGARGFHTSEYLRLEVDPDLPESHARITLLHEILHAIHGYFDVGDDDKEERFTDVGASGLVMFARDNPEIWAWIGAQK